MFITNTLILTAEAQRCWYACKIVIQWADCEQPHTSLSTNHNVSFCVSDTAVFLHVGLLHSAKFLETSEQKHTYSLLWLAEFHILEDFKTCVPTQLLPGASSTGPLVASAASTQIISCMISTFFYLVHKNNITWHHSVLISLNKQCQQLQAL